MIGVALFDLIPEALQLGAKAAQPAVVLALVGAGFCGYMLGITANAMASMEELVEKYGPASASFLVVPVVGAFLIDFTNSLIITAFANLLR